MPTRYLEINSTYRMREDWPEPGEFDVIAGNIIAEDADPEALYLPEMPEYSFEFNTYSMLTPFIAPFSQSNPLVHASSMSTYNGYMADNVAHNDKQLIYNYDTSTLALTMRLPFQVPPVAGNLCLLKDPSPETYPSDGSHLFYNIQTTGMPYKQTPVITATYYVGYYLVNDDAPAGTVDAQLIDQYNTTLRQVKLKAPLSNIGPYASGHRFSIRKRPPFFRGHSIVAVNTKRNMLTLDATASTKDDAYKGMYIFINPVLFDEAFPNFSESKKTFGQYCIKIISYDGATRQASLATAISGNVSAPIAGRKYEILNDIRDSYSPLQYVMSTVSSSEPRCMKVSLISLILPNVPLRSGSRIAFYPFVYVELRNESSAKTMGQNLIYSNNPNSTRAVFICPIVDIAKPTRTPFIKISSSGMTQLMKFKPNDTFFFRVFLPDGSLFQAIELDNPSPLQPNPLLQIEALFSYRET